MKKRKKQRRITVDGEGALKTQRCCKCGRMKSRRQFGQQDDRAVPSWCLRCCRDAKARYRKRYPRRAKAAYNKYFYTHRHDRVVAARKYNHRNKMEALRVYSHGAMSCSCCGEREVKFLAIDHRFNNGKQEREAGMGNGTGFYNTLRRMGFPKNRGYQVLCHNCNQAKSAYGVCPHQLRKEK